MRFAAMRAANTGGGVEILSIIPPEEFNHWLGVGEVLRRSNDELEVTAEGPGGEDSDLLCAGAVDLATTSRPIRPTSASAATRPASRWPS